MTIRELLPPAFEERLGYVAALAWAKYCRSPTPNDWVNGFWLRIARERYERGHQIGVVR
jgi:hypothetical protein